MESVVLTGYKNKVAKIISANLFLLGQDLCLVEHGNCHLLHRHFTFLIFNKYLDENFHDSLKDGLLTASLVSYSSAHNHS